MADRYLLDTYLLIEWLKGNREIVSRVRAAGPQNCFVAELSVLELAFGSARAPEDVLRKVYGRKPRPLFPIMPLETVHHATARFEPRLDRRGHRIDAYDLLAGATALYHDLTFAAGGQRLTYDHKLRTEHWMNPVAVESAS